MDQAKTTAALVTNGGKCVEWDYVELPHRMLPTICIPTTAGTGSEVTQVSVVSHGREKRTINNPVFMPRAAIVDPELTLGVPPRTTMNTGLDAMAHALEGSWSRNHQPISDLAAVEAVRLILENLERAWRDGSDLEARTNMQARANMALASLRGGLSFALP